MAEMSKEDKESLLAERAERERATKWVQAWFLLLAVWLAGISIIPYYYPKWDGFFWPWWGWIGLVAVVVLFVPFVVLGLAPLDVFVGIVREGEQKIVVLGGQVVDMLTQYGGRDVDVSWNIADNPALFRHRPWWRKICIGSLRVIGLYPFHRVASRHIRYDSLRANGEVVHHDRWVSSLTLKRQAYVFVVKDAETSDGVPMTIYFVVPMWRINSYLSDVVMMDWLEMVRARLEPVLINFVSSKTSADLVSKKRLMGTDIWDAIVAANLPLQIRGEIGIAIGEGEVAIINIVPNAAYQSAAEKEAEQKQLRAAARIEADKQALVFTRFSKAVEDKGELGKFVLQQQTLQRMADKGNVFFVDTSGEVGRAVLQGAAMAHGSGQKKQKPQDGGGEKGGKRNRGGGGESKSRGGGDTKGKEEDEDEESSS